MTDWTLIATTLGTASITGILGYAAARRGSKVQLAQIEAENERLQEQHREDHRRNRQGTYHEFVSIDRKFVNLITPTAPDMEPEALGKLMDRWLYLANGVLLFGTQEVAERMKVLLDLYQSAAVEAGSAEEKGQGSGPAMIEVFERRATEFRKTRKELLEAMRDDIGPRIP